MRYRINSGPWCYYSEENGVKPLEQKGHVIVTIDPGKTNMAVVVGDAYGVIYNYIEISGQGCDTTQYCTDFSNFITSYLSNVKLWAVGVEAAVSYKGMHYHRSQMVLTEVRANILQLFRVHFGKQPVEINNWAWKKAILPEGYRGTQEKGSLRFLNELGFTGVTHDVTDCICMYMWMHKNVPAAPPPFCDESEMCFCKYSTEIFASDGIPDGVEGMWDYTANPQFSLQDNIHYYLNRSIGNGVLRVNASMLSLEEIYKMRCYLKAPTEELKVVVVRT